MKKSWLLCCFLTAFVTTAPAQVANASVINPGEQAKGLQKQLNLTDEQTTKVAAIYKESSDQLEKIKLSAHGDSGKIAKSSSALRASTNQKIKSLLTPAQAAKFHQLAKHGKAG